MRPLVALYVACQLAAIPARTQNITLDLVDKPLPFVLDAISKAGAGHCAFTFNDKDVLFDHVTLQVKQLPLQQVLKILFTDIPLECRTKDGINYSFQRMKARSLQGRVVNEVGEAEPKVSVCVLHTHSHTLTNEWGEFKLDRVWDNSRLQISGVNIEKSQGPAPFHDNEDIRVRRKISSLPRVTVDNIANNGLQSMNAANCPGSFFTLGDKALHQFPVNNIGMMLAGQIPGLLVDPSVNNTLGFVFHGLSTLGANSAPAVVVDGFPFYGSLAAINPNDIVSIVLLKDAVAAGIWGPASANGVLVITTRNTGYKDSLQMSLTMSCSWTGRPDLLYIPQISSPSYIGMEETQFRQGNYNKILADPNYPVTPVVYLLSQEQSHSIITRDADAQIRYLSQIDTRRELMTYFYRPRLNQQFYFNAGKGDNKQHYFLSAGYDHDPTDLDRDAYERYTLNGAYTRELIPHRLEVTALVRLTGTHTLDNNPGDLPVTYPYAPLADSKGNALSVNYKYNPGYIDTAGGGRLLDWRYRPLQELALADNSTHGYAGFMQAGLNYHVSSSLSAVLNYRYSKGSSQTNDVYSQNSFFARDLINEYTELNGAQTIYPIPRGAMDYRSDTTFKADHLRLQMIYCSPAGKRHRLIVMGGAELDDLVVTGADQWLYDYNPHTGASSPVDYVHSYPNYITGNTALIPGSSPPLGLYNRYLSMFGNASYTLSNQYSFYGAWRRDATNITGTAANRQWAPFWSFGAGWEITRNRQHPSKLLPLLKWRLTYGCNGNIGDRIAALQTQNLGPNTYGAAESGIFSAPNPNLSWEKTYVLNTGLDFALLQDRQSPLGRIRGSVDGYLKRSDHLLGNDTVPPSAGLPVFYDNTAAIRGHGIDLVLNTDNIRIRDIFRWTTTVLFSWSVDQVSRYLLQPSYPSAYVSGLYPTVGQPATALLAYRWAGLDSANGNPRGCFNGQVSENYASIMNSAGGAMHARGSYQPLVFGSVTNSFRWKSWTLSAMLLFKTGYWFRRPSINYNLMITGAYPGDRDYDQRWQAPGDERRTTVPSFPAVNDPNRDIFYQNSDVLVTRGDQLRCQYLRLDYALPRYSRSKAHWQKAIVYACVTNPGILWRANPYHIDPDAASFGTVPAMKTYSVGMQLNF